MLHLKSFIIIAIFSFLFVSLFVVPRYRADDGVYDWHTFYGGSDTDWAFDLAVDDNGNVYIAGTSDSSWQGDGNTSPLHPHSNSDSDIFILKLNSAGTYQWHTFYGGGSTDWANALVVDSIGNVYVVGQSQSSWLGDWNTSPLHTHSGNDDMVILKLNSAGSYQWHTFYGGIDIDRATDLAIGNNENLYVAGYSRTSWQGDGSINPLHQHSSSSSAYDLVMMKLSNTGNYLWHTFYGGNDQDWSTALVVDDFGDVYETGYSNTTWLGDGDFSPLHAHSGSDDMVIIKLSSAGSYEWHTFYGGSSDDWANALAVDDGENVYIAGLSHVTWQGDGDVSPLHAHSSGMRDMVIMKLNVAGVYQWHTFYGGSHEDCAMDLAVDTNGNVYIAGYSWSTWQGDGDTSPIHAHTEGYDLTTLQVSGAGSYQWHTFYGGSNNDWAEALAVDDLGNVYETGYSLTSWKGDGNATPIHAYTGSYDITVVKLAVASTQQHKLYMPIVIR